MKKIFFLLALLFLSQPVLASVLKLNDGQIIEGDIVEQKDNYVKIDFYGINITYWFDEIQSIDGKAVVLPNMPTKKEIEAFLKVWQYPEKSWPDIERELRIFFRQIDLPILMVKAQRFTNNPEELRRLVIGVGELLEQYGYRDFAPPHKLIQLLINSLVNDDILSLIDSNKMSIQEKDKEKRKVYSYTALAQLGSIVLNFLGIDTKLAIAPNHVFNIVLLNDQEALFVDFSFLLFEFMDIGKWYNKEGKYFALKDEYRVSAEQLFGIIEKRKKGTPLGQREILNLIFFYIDVFDNNICSANIYSAIGKVYAEKGELDQAVDCYKKALEINPNLAETYLDRSKIYIKKGEGQKALSENNMALAINPNFAEAYSMRGQSYTLKGDFQQAYLDCNKALEIDPNLADGYVCQGNVNLNLNDLEQALSDYGKALTINPFLSEVYINRGNIYVLKGNIQKALEEYSKSININKNIGVTYFNRAQIYFNKGDYNNTWKDVHQAQSLGYEVPEKFLQALSKASHRKN